MNGFGIRLGYLIYSGERFTLIDVYLGFGAQASCNESASFNIFPEYSYLYLKSRSCGLY